MCLLELFEEAGGKVATTANIVSAKWVSHLEGKRLRLSPRAARLVARGGQRVGVLPSSFSPLPGFMRSGREKF